MRWENQSRATGFIAPCLPTVATTVPLGPLWIHEIKHDGYRLLVRKSGERVRIFTRRGADWTHRFPLIVEAANKIKAKSFHLDGEGVVCDGDGLAVFDLLHSKANDERVFLYAFDLLELNGADVRRWALDDRKDRLAKLLQHSARGIVLNQHIDGDGAMVFKHAFLIGCEGIVSKRRDLPYRSGRVKSWLKIKNPESPAMLRIEEGTF